MATAIEYGLVAALVSVAAVAGIKSLPNKPTNAITAVDSQQPPTYDQPPLEEVGNQDPMAKSVLMFDQETLCYYIATSTGITIRYRKGLPDCVDAVGPFESKRKEK